MRAKRAFQRTPDGAAEFQRSATRGNFAVRRQELGLLLPKAFRNMLGGETNQSYWGRSDAVRASNEGLDTMQKFRVVMSHVFHNQNDT